jgi:chaperonin GroEL
MSDSVIGLLAAANQAPEKFFAMGVKTPKTTSDVQAQIIEDLSILVGGRAVIQAAGQVIRDVKLEELGWARRAWADLHNLGIIGGRGEARRLRQHIAALRMAHQRADNPSQRDELQARIGKLIGGSAILRIGAATETELEPRLQLARRTASAMRAAILEGVLPGGGVALLNCRPTLSARLAGCQDADQRAAFQILLKALEVPAHTIIHNAGFDASEVMAEIRSAGPNFGFDVRTAQVVELEPAGILDVAGVQKAAVSSAILGAALALTVDVLVHKEKPDVSSGP